VGKEFLLDMDSVWVIVKESETKGDGEHAVVSGATEGLTLQFDKNVLCLAIFSDQDMADRYIAAENLQGVASASFDNDFELLQFLRSQVEMGIRHIAPDPRVGHHNTYGPIEQLIDHVK
jgi:hypothetical protein